MPGGEDDGVGLLGVDDLAGERGVETDLCAVLLQLIAEVEHEGRILGLSRRRHSGEPLAADLIAGFENGDLMAALRAPYAAARPETPAPATNTFFGFSTTDRS